MSIIFEVVYVRTTWGSFENMWISDVTGGAGRCGGV